MFSNVGVNLQYQLSNTNSNTNTGTNRSRLLIRSAMSDVVRTVETIQSQILAMIVMEIRGKGVEVKRMKRLESMLYDISERVASSIRDSVRLGDDKMEGYVDIAEALLCGKSCT